MALTFTVGGTKGTFEDRFASEVAGVLDHAFGAEGDWEGVPPRHYGELAGSGWKDFQVWAVSMLGRESASNILALGDDGRGVYLPANLQAVSLPLSAGGPLRCASLPGLRRELAELAECCDLPVDDQALMDIVQVHCDPDDGFVADAPEILTYARLALAANEAVRRDCPLWLVGQTAVGGPI